VELREVRRGYGRTARGYDRRLRFWFGHVLRIEEQRVRAVEALGPLDGARVLDIGCGTGANLPLLVPRVGSSGRVVGLDYTQAMLDRARARVSEAGWGGVELSQGDAVTLDAVEGPFDAILSTYCFGLLYDIERATDRAIDLLSPGGRLVILDFQRVRPAGPLGRVYPLYAALLRWYGISASEDLDETVLRRRWAAAKAVMRARLSDFEETRFLFDLGVLASGTR